MEAVKSEPLVGSSKFPGIPPLPQETRIWQAIRKIRKMDGLELRRKVGMEIHSGKHQEVQ